MTFSPKLPWSSDSKKEDERNWLGLLINRTKMRTGGQRTAFEIRNCINATIHSCYLLLSGQI